MDRKRAKELLPIITAFAEGKTVQFRPYGHQPDGSGLYGWSDMPDRKEVITTFPADDYEYRIKPEPREFWIGRANKAGVFEVMFFNPIETESERVSYGGWEWIKVREVLE